ncbi:hypothetical protein TKK_0005456 [Trichogramma kaykai]|uniref:Uncharacterized protein n=1 Tax=Trichogramma kaykai TaxID=54128 RepID=A0ABD2XIM8_9HYME
MAKKRSKNQNGRKEKTRIDEESSDTLNGHKQKTHIDKESSDTLNQIKQRYEKIEKQRKNELVTDATKPKNERFYDELPSDIPRKDLLHNNPLYSLRDETNSVRIREPLTKFRIGYDWLRQFKVIVCVLCFSLSYLIATVFLSVCMLSAITSIFDPEDILQFINNLKNMFK